MSKLLLPLMLTALISCASAPVPITSTVPNTGFRTEFYDGSRSRRVPVAIYGASGTPRPLAVISPGWGEPHAAQHLDYTFIADALARQGYIVAAIQHQLPSDPQPPSVGNVALLRRPSWQVGVANILLVDQTLRGLGVIDTSRGALLVGHSHGGDISMLFATLHPEAVDAVFTLDNRRMRLPLTHRPRICTLRSIDTPADEGVLPSISDQRRLGMLVERSVDLKHNDMSDVASPAQKRAMLQALQRCVQGVVGRGSGSQPREPVIRKQKQRLAR
jgi:pimeloyl-ACP methyl ester carboxylesterase